MTNTHQTTPEEEAYERLLDENWEALSKAARSIIEDAHSAAYAAKMVRSYCYDPREYEEALQKMSLAAADLIDGECELLMEIVRRAIHASASLDPFDEDTLVAFRAYRSDLHRFYRMASDMITSTLYAEWNRQWHAERGPIDPEDIPF